MNMNLNRYRSSRRLAAMLTGVGLLCFAGLYAFAQPPVVQRGDQATGQREAKEEESLEVRYARAHLDLAKLDLKRAEYWNQRIPDIITNRTMDFLRKHVEVDAEQLRQSQQPDFADIHQIYVRGAKAALDLAESDVARKQAAFEEVGGTYTALELDRAIAVLNVARLNYERTVSQQDSLQTISYLQWQLEELRNQILELQIKSESFSERK